MTDNRLSPPRRSRREVLAALGAAGAAAGLGGDSLLGRLAAQPACPESAARGDLIGTLPLSRVGAPVQPFGVKFGGVGLDARMITDLSGLDTDRLITPADRIFIRTECPQAAKSRTPWVIKTALASSPADPVASLALEDLTSAAQPMGRHLLECSGNNNPANFGLMSVAEWDGVPLTHVVPRLPRLDGSVGLFIGGLDYERRSAGGSIPGASWIFPLEMLERLGAFLAVRVNGEPLPFDHGRPVRLVVPGWYGCTWIKWVDEIRFVSADEPATTQMTEFAGRTHQTARHALARDYAPAAIEAAAAAIRIEKRRLPAGLAYRIVGIVWGGSGKIERLAIRFGPRDGWTAFSVCPAGGGAGGWSLWDYEWKPSAPGRYDIALRIADASVPQRRLDAGYYMRQVSIDEV